MVLSKRTRLFTLLATVLTLTILLAIPVLAATSVTADAAVLNYEGKVNGVSFSYTAGNGAVTHASTSEGYAKFTITSTATGNFLTGWTNQKTEFQITNNESFDINATIEVGTNVSGTGGTVKIGTGKTITFTVESGNNWGFSAPSKSGTVTVNALVPDVSRYSTMFKGAVGGTYSVSCSDGTTVTQGVSHSTTSAEEYTLTLASTDTASGYTFYGWMHSAQGIISTNSTATYKTSETYDGCSVYPVFQYGENAMYYIIGEGDEYYYYLDEAIDAATSDTSGTIMVLGSGEVVATEAYRNNTNNYDDAGNLKFTLSSGQELVVPYSTDDKSHVGLAPDYMMATPAGVYYDILTNDTKKFRELIVPAGVTIECQSGSAINVDATQRADDSASFPGTVGGYFGQITLMNDATASSKIVLKSGANLYCYGFIVSEDHNGNINTESTTGQVIAESGSHVYEFLEISDWRGGTMASYAAVGYFGTKADAFVFSQYYVQNISSSFTIHSGATETVYFAMSYEGTEHIQTPVDFIGASSLFRLGSDSYMTRKYNAATDRMKYDIYGDMTLDQMTVEMAMGVGSEGSVELDSGSYIFPLQSNFDIFVHTGTITLNQRFKMHPGCYIEIMEDAAMTFGSSGKLYIYSKDDFDGAYIYSGKSIEERPNNHNWTYSATEIGISPSQYAPGRGSGMDLNRDVRTWANTGDAQLVINGQMTTAGNILTSNTGNGLSGIGKITVSSVASDTSFVEFKQSAASSSLYPVDAYKSVDFKSVNGQLAGISGLQKLGTGTYYGTESGYWYNYIINIGDDSAPAASTVASHITRTSQPTTLASTPEVYDGYTGKNVVGYIANSNDTNGTFTFTVSEGVSNISASNGTVNPTNGTAETAYTLTGATGDVTLTVSETYRSGWRSQIGLIEPWFLGINVTIVNSDYTQIDYSNLTDYGYYFIRARHLDAEGTPTAEQIVADPDAVLYGKETIKTQSDGTYTYFYAEYAEGIYTYEMSESIFAVFYFVEGDGERQYTVVTEYNLKNLLKERKDDEDFKKLERTVYEQMYKLEGDITAYRVGKTDSTTTMGELLTADMLGVPSTDATYKFGVRDQIVLIEPWGLQVNAAIVPSNATSVSEHIDYDSADDYGVVMYYDVNGTITDITQLDTPEEMLALTGSAYVFSKNDGSAFINPDNGNYITARYNKDVNTYQLNTELYALYYVKIDGKYYYSNVRIYNVYDLAKERGSDSSFGDELERNVYLDMVNLYSAITAYRDDYFSRIS